MAFVDRGKTVTTFLERKTVDTEVAAVEIPLIEQSGLKPNAVIASIRSIPEGFESALPCLLVGVVFNQKLFTKLCWTASQAVC